MSLPAHHKADSRRDCGHGVARGAQVVATASCSSSGSTVSWGGTSVEESDEVSHGGTMERWSAGGVSGSIVVVGTAGGDVTGGGDREPGQGNLANADDDADVSFASVAARGLCALPWEMLDLIFKWVAQLEYNDERRAANASASSSASSPSVSRSAADRHSGTTADWPCGVCHGACACTSTADAGTESVVSPTLSGPSTRGGRAVPSAASTGGPGLATSSSYNSFEELRRQASAAASPSSRPLARSAMRSSRSSNSLLSLAAEFTTTRLSLRALARLRMVCRTFREASDHTYRVTLEAQPWFGRNTRLRRARDQFAARACEPVAPPLFIVYDQFRSVDVRHWQRSAKRELVFRTFYVRVLVGPAPGFGRRVGVHYTWGGWADGTVATTSGGVWQFNATYDDHDGPPLEVWDIPLTQVDADMHRVWLAVFAHPVDDGGVGGSGGGGGGGEAGANMAAGTSGGDYMDGGSALVSGPPTGNHVAWDNNQGWNFEVTNANLRDTADETVECQNKACFLCRW